MRFLQETFKFLTRSYKILISIYPKGILCQVSYLKINKMPNETYELLDLRRSLQDFC